MTTRSAVSNFINNFGIFAQDVSSKISARDASQLQGAVGEMFIQCVEGIVNIRAERSLIIGPSGARLPPVLPFQLSPLQPFDFRSALLEQRDRLLFSWEAQSVESLEQDFRAFKSALQNEPPLTALLDGATATDDFAEPWAPFWAKVSKAAGFLWWTRHSLSPCFQYGVL